MQLVSDKAARIQMDSQNPNGQPEFNTLDPKLVVQLHHNQIRRGPSIFWQF